MNFKQLEVFVAIVETGSFSKGAERTSLTQSTASQHVASLENLCGVRLLDRIGRGAMPTEAGKVLLEHARKVLSSLRLTKEAIDRFSRSEEVMLKVVASTIPGTYLVPKAFKIMQDTMPGVNLSITITDSRGVSELLLNEEAEIGVSGMPVSDRQLQGEPVGQDRIVLVAPSKHRWSSDRHITLSELASEPLIVREEGSGTDRVVQEAMNQCGLPLAKTIRRVVINSSEGVKQAVLAGCGVAFLSEVAVKKDLAAGSLREVSIQGLNMSRTFTLISRRGRDLSPAALALSRAVKEVATALPC